MKDENKIKKLFVTQYWGQKVYKPETVSDPMEVNSGDMGSGYLLLRSIGQLTDEEMLIVAGIFDLDESQIEDTDLQEWIEALFDESAGYYIDGYTGNQLLSYTDYLRSIGILLPITYLDEENKPVTIQPEEILKRGWAKYQGICKH